MQIKTTVRYYYTPKRMGKILKKVKTPNTSKHVEEFDQ